MFQIDTSTAAAVEPTPAAPGTPGFFTDGNPVTNTPATIVSSDWFNAITDELLAVLTAAGISPVKATHNQVVTAIQTLVLAGINGFAQTYAGNPNGHVAGTAGVAGVSAPSLVWDSAESTVWICTTTGNAASAVWTRNSTMQVYAGNPNGNVAGNAGAVSGASPAMIWDSTDKVLWVCTTTGTSSTAVWAEVGSTASWPFWCGTSTGTANAQIIATPAAMQAFSTGTGASFTAGYTNTGAMTLTVGTFGTFPVKKEGPLGPTALTGGEWVVGNIISGRFDGVNFQLTATEMGTAALANASSASGVVAAVSGSGSITPGHLAVFSDALGTVVDGGAAGVAAPPTVVNGATTLAPGVYLVDTSAGPFAVSLVQSLGYGVSWTFMDASGTFSPNNFTINLGSYTVTLPGATTPQAGPITCNTAGEQMLIWNAGTTLKLF